MSRPGWAEGFLAFVASQPGPVQLGQLQIDRQPDGWRLGPDLEADAETCPLQQLRERARRTERGVYRPLPTSPDLPHGWLCTGLDDDGLIDAIEAVYPGALAAWHAERTGRLRVVHWRQVQRRQTGQQGLLKRLDDADAARAAAVFCGPAACLRRRLWQLDADQPIAAPAGAGAIPCYEPCSLFVSFARELVGVRRGERAADDPRLAAALGLEA